MHEVLDRERERAQKEALAQADEIVADARHEVESLQTYAERMRSLLIESQRALVELAEAAIGQLDDASGVTVDSGQEELLNDLRPSELAEKASPTTVAGD